MTEQDSRNMQRISAAIGDMYNLGLEEATIWVALLSDLATSPESERIAQACWQAEQVVAHARNQQGNRVSAGERSSDGYEPTSS